MARLPSVAFELLSSSPREPARPAHAGRGRRNPARV